MKSWPIENDREPKDIKMSKQKCVDLFAGTGAFSYVLEKHGFECVFANDMLPNSKKIYELNNDKEDKIFRLDDLHNVDVDEIPSHDLLCGGFPCQPFSIAGNQNGFNDKRSNVFWKIVDILKKHTPDKIILENVKNLTSHDKGNTFRIIREKLEEIGYHLRYQVLDTCKITNVPQHRERIYIVGFRKKEEFDAFQFDIPCVETKNVSDFIEKNVLDKYYYTNKFKVYQSVIDGVIKDISENTLYQYRRYYVRENKSNCCPTLTANMVGGGHNVPLLRDEKGVRKLTPRECFSFQGFPDTYKLPEDLSDTALYHLAGNAVSVPVVECIINKLTQL